MTSEAVVRKSRTTASDVKNYLVQGYNLDVIISVGHEIIKSVHPHPTMSEAIMEAAAAAYGEVIHL